jgi:hypothetical protein
MAGWRGGGVAGWRGGEEARRRGGDGEAASEENSQTFHIPLRIGALDAKRNRISRLL